jgi:methyl coenzyme M reductase alpha subunit
MFQNNGNLGQGIVYSNVTMANSLYENYIGNYSLSVFHLHSIREVGSAAIIDPVIQVIFSSENIIYHFQLAHIPC